jgi:hypothetical protein
MINAALQDTEHSLSCQCGVVCMRVSGSPVARAYCHCASCREFYGVAVLAATAWKSESVCVVKGQELVSEHQHPTKQLRRYFCSACGTHLHGVNRLGFKVIQTSLFAKAMGGAVPKDLSPEFHLFYAQRELSINDDLPKYLEGKSGAIYVSDAPILDRSTS